MLVLRQAPGLLITFEYAEFSSQESKTVCFLNNPRRTLMPEKGRAVLCGNWEHPEKLIKTFLFDYTPEDGNRFLSRLSLTQLAQEECKGWVGSSPTGEWKEATYQRDDGVSNAAAAESTSTLWDSRFAVFQRHRQRTGKKEKKMHLTASLSGDLDKSGTHFQVAFRAEIYMALQIPVSGASRAQVCIYSWSTLSFSGYLARILNIEAMWM